MTRIETPRPEYPSPDFQRGTSEGIDWINLNGEWEFAFDPDDVGEKEEWFSPNAPDFPLQIQCHTLGKVLLLGKKKIVLIAQPT